MSPRPLRHLLALGRSRAPSNDARRRSGRGAGAKAAYARRDLARPARHPEGTQTAPEATSPPRHSRSAAPRHAASSGHRRRLKARAWPATEGTQPWGRPWWMETRERDPARAAQRGAGSTEVTETASRILLFPGLAHF